MYTPILRNKQSELLAIRHLGESVRTDLMPLLDVAVPTKADDKANPRKYVERNLTRTRNDAAGFPAVFVDSSELDPAFRLPNNLHPLAALAAAIADVGGQPIPVTGLHRDAAHHKAAISIANDLPKRRLCLRLDATDVSTATQTMKRVQYIVEAEGLDPVEVYLLFDLQCLYSRDRDSMAKQVLRLLKLLEPTVWGGIIIGGYGMPDQISSAVSTKEQGYLPRIEQDVFRDAAAYEMSTPRWFADYTVVPPSVVELDWKLIRKVLSPKALYTLDDLWFVVRGGAFASHPKEYDQYFDLAEEIAALDDFCGSDFSYGDKYIAERAAGTARRGVQPRG